MTPVHPGVLLFVQFLVQGPMAAISAAAVSLTGFLIFGMKIEGSVFVMIIGYVFVLISIFSIGLTVASTAKDSKKAGTICSALYFPMLLLSGTTVPFQVFPKFIQEMARFLPLRQGIILLKGLAAGKSFFDFALQIGVLAGIALIGIVVSILTFKWDME